MAGISLPALEEMPDVLATDRFLFDITPAEGADATLVRTFRLRCQQVVVPGIQTEQMIVGLHGHELVFAGRRLFAKTMAATFVETVGAPVLSGLRAWAEICRGTRSGNGAYKSEYAGTATVTVLDTTGAETLVIKINKLWPQDIQDVQLDGTSGTNPFLQMCTFSYDFHDMEGVEDSPAGEEASS